MRTVYMALLLLCSATISFKTFSQGMLSKIGGGLYQAQKASDTYGQVRGLFGKKKKQQDSTVNSSSPAPVPSITPVAPTAPKKTTIITVKGIEFAKLRVLSDSIRSCESVDSTVIKFSSDVSLITVMHTCSTDELLEEMGKTCKDIFSEKNIESFEEGDITIKL